MRRGRPPKTECNGTARCSTVGYRLEGWLLERTWEASQKVDDDGSCFAEKRPIADFITCATVANADEREFADSRRIIGIEKFL